MRTTKVSMKGEIELPVEIRRKYGIDRCRKRSENSHGWPRIRECRSASVMDPTMLNLFCKQKKHSFHSCFYTSGKMGIEKKIETTEKWRMFKGRRVMPLRDFTLKKYKELCLALLDSSYTPQTVYSYLVLGGQKNNNNNKLVVLRHDIDSGFSHHQWMHRKQMLL